MRELLQKTEFGTKEFCYEERPTMEVPMMRTALPKFLFTVLPKVCYSILFYNFIIPHIEFVVNVPVRL